MRKFKQIVALFFAVTLGGVGANFLPPISVMANACPPGYIEVAVPIDGERCIPGGSADDNPIFYYLRGVVKFLSAGVGVVVLLMIVISGVQYIASGGNPEAVKGAKKRLTNALIALVLFILMAAILNFVVPGGVFG